MTSNTGKQANYIRNYVGGKQRLIKLSGSDAPLRFTGIVIRRVAEQFPEAYQQTGKIQLLSSFITATLTGNVEVPIDFGNGCGTSLMDYINRQWSDILIEATSKGLPGGKQALKRKLPPVSAPDSIVGNIATYFVRKYGFRPDCRIVAGSGDNPQSKVLVAGDLLSLGTSFVNMVSTDGMTLDMDGYANAMYDGVGRPFIFGCRTNGVMVWDRVRAMYGIEKEEYEPAEEALQQTPLARYMVFWQPRNESFPPSGSFDLVRISHEAQSLGSDYAGIIETTLATMYIHSRHFTKETSEPLHVTAGANNSEGIMRRVAVIWNRPVIRMEKAGAAMGAAVAGAHAYLKSNDETVDVKELSASLLQRREPIYPRPEEVSTYHDEGGYLERMALEEEKLVETYTL
jgi:xylulokinase